MPLIIVVARDINLFDEEYMQGKCTNLGLSALSDFSIRHWFQYAASCATGGGPPRVTHSRGWHPKKKIEGEFTKNSGRTRWSGKKGAGWHPPRGWHPSESSKSDSDEQKRSSVFFRKKWGNTLSCRPGDTNPSDATVCSIRIVSLRQLSFSLSIFEQISVPLTPVCRPIRFEICTLQHIKVYYFMCPHITRIFPHFRYLHFLIYSFFAHCILCIFRTLQYYANDSLHFPFPAFSSPLSTCYSLSCENLICSQKVAPQEKPHSR